MYASDRAGMRSFSKILILNRTLAVYPGDLFLAERSPSARCTSYMQQSWMNVDAEFDIVNLPDSPASWRSIDR